MVLQHRLDINCGLIKESNEETAPLFIAMSFAGLSTTGYAEDLLQVYQKAKESNPELRKSQAERNQAFEKINEARSPLLPQLGLGAGYTYNSGYRDTNNTENNQLSASLKLTQTIFDMSKWRQLTLQEKAPGSLMWLIKLANNN